MAGARAFQGMKDWRRPVGTLAAALFALTSVQGAEAQPPQAVELPRADVTGMLGWLNADKGDLGSYNDWYNRSLYGGLAAGWYWTEHVKTEVDAGASTKADLYVARTLSIDGRPVYTQSELTFATRRVSVSHQYQFFRNAWFHPHVAAGADLTWETTTERMQPLFVYDEASRQGRQVDPGRTAGPETRLIVRPIAAAGFKAYMTPRTYFRTDLRLAIRTGVDEAVWRCGFGVDF